MPLLYRRTVGIGGGERGIIPAKKDKFVSNLFEEEGGRETYEVPLWPQFTERRS